MATSIKLDDELEGRLQHLAEIKRRSAHWLMREAIAQYVAREEARERFKQEALSSWTDFQQNGRHLSDDETRRWLKSWGTADEMPAPECHE